MAEDADKKITLNWFYKSLIGGAVSILVALGSYFAVNFVTYITSMKSEIRQLKVEIAEIKADAKTTLVATRLKFDEIQKFQVLLSSTILTTNKDTINLSSQVRFLERAIGLEEWVKWLKENHFNLTKEKKMARSTRIRKKDEGKPLRPQPRTTNKSTKAIMRKLVAPPVPLKGKNEYFKLKLHQQMQEQRSQDQQQMQAE